MSREDLIDGLAIGFVLLGFVFLYWLAVSFDY